MRKGDPLTWLLLFVRDDTSDEGRVSRTKVSHQFIQLLLCYQKPKPVYQLINLFAFLINSVVCLLKKLIRHN